jgi:hypothetical protein
MSGPFIFLAWMGQAKLSQRWKERGEPAHLLSSEELFFTSNIDQERSVDHQCDVPQSYNCVGNVVPSPRLTVSLVPGVPGSTALRGTSVQWA